VGVGTVKLTRTHPGIAEVAGVGALAAVLLIFHDVWKQVISMT
jgi:hypothetical protein